MNSVLCGVYSKVGNATVIVSTVWCIDVCTRLSADKRGTQVLNSEMLNLKKAKNGT